jgi:hypothetical protein
MRNLGDFFFAWGRKALRDARKEEVEETVRARYSERLADAGLLRRLCLSLRIRREIRQELERLAPPDAMFLQH